MTNPDYSQWSLNELHSGLEDIDVDTQPQHMQEIQTQIRVKTRALEREKTQTKHRSITLNRVKAFSFDLIFTYGPYLVINTLFVYPKNSAWLDVFGLIFFVSYFLFFEGFLTKPSPGKRLFRLKLVNSAGLPPKFTSILLRMAIITMLISALQWPNVLPQLLDLIINALLYSAVLYSIYLASFSSDKHILLDIVSKTWVCHAIDDQSPEDTVDGISQSRTTIRHHGTIMAGLFCVMLLGIFSLGNMLNTQQQTQTSAQSIDQHLENIIGDQLNIKSKITVNDIAISRFSSQAPNKESYNELQVIVQISLWDWNKTNQQKIVEMVMDALTVTPDYYKSGSIELKTSWGIMDQSQTTYLDMP